MTAPARRARDREKHVRLEDLSHPYSPPAVANGHQLGRIALGAPRPACSNQRTGTLSVRPGAVLGRTT
jgi:hypothetical protein